MSGKLSYPRDLHKHARTKGSLMVCLAFDGRPGDTPGVTNAGFTAFTSVQPEHAEHIAKKITALYGEIVKLNRPKKRDRSSHDPLCPHCNARTPEVELDDGTEVCQQCEQNTHDDIEGEAKMERERENA